MIRFSASAGLRRSASVVPLLLLAAWTFPMLADESPKADEADDLKLMRRLAPVEPKDALKTFQLEKGFRLELVAHEPDVADPVDACFDENGRMFVAEMHGYPYSPEPRPQCPDGRGKENAGLIRLLEDTDGDGRMDRSIVYADDISWPTSVCCYDGGVFVIAPPHLWYFKDTDGDNVADVREVVYSGFSRSNVQGLANNLKWGLDNRIYGAGGTNSNELTHRGKPLLALGRRDFAFDPKTEKLDPVSGGLQFGHSMDDWGNRFVCSNSNHILHVVFPEKYLARTPLLSAPGAVRSIAKEGGAAPVFRRSPAEPWRIVRTARRAADPKYADRLPESELVPTGFFTSATGVTIYRGGSYPEEFHGNAFIGDVGGNLVHRKYLKPEGASFLAVRADQNTEFLTSTDTWFRPVNFVNAPDGTLYILDMYRETIEHPYSIPEDIKAHLDLESGDNRGRIYRLVAPDTKRATPPKLGKASVTELVAQLDSPNSWNRETAQRLLWERQDKSAVAPLTAALRSHSALGRLHAMYALDGLKALTPELLAPRVKDESAGVREHAIGLAEPHLDSSADLLASVCAAAADESPRVRFQTAFSLGAAEDPQAVAALVSLIERHGRDRDLRVACLTSLGSRLDQSIPVLVDQLGTGTPNRAVVDALAELCRMAGAERRTGPALAVLKTAAATDNRVVQSRIIQALGEGLNRRGAGLQSLLADASIDGDTQRQVQALFESAADAAVDEDAPMGERASAVALLAFAPFEEAADGFETLLAAQVPQTLQLAAVRAAAQQNDKRVAGLLLDAWSGLSPKVRAEVIDALTASADRADALLTAVAESKIKPAEVDRDKQQLLLNHPTTAIRNRARDVFGAVRTDRARVVAEYRKALDLAGDVARGREFFAQKCATCHRVGNTGYAVGPDLASVQNKSPEDLLISILDPNREAQSNYTTYTVVTVEGRILNGIIAAESAASLTLRRAEAKEDVVTRSNIDVLASNGTSLMPEGLEKEISAAQMADLLAFIRTIKPAK